MKRSKRLLLYVYSCLINLFPRGYRDEYRDELQAVFSLEMEDATKKGKLFIMRRGFRELLDFPSSLLYQYWRVFQRREARMSNWIGLDKLLDEQFANNGDAPPLASRKEITLAVVPFILLALFLSMPQLLVLAGLTTWDSRAFSILQIVYGVSVVLLLLGGLVFAWRADWPRWSASWYVFFGVLSISPLIFLSNFFEDVSRAADIFNEAVAFFLLPVLIAWFLYRVTRLDPIKGQLAVLPLVILIWTPNMEFVPDQIEAPITLASLIIAALAAAAILKLGDWRNSVWLLILVVALVGLLFAYAGIYHGGSLPFSAPFPNPVEVLKNFMPQFLAVSTLVIGPLLAVSFRGIGRHSGITGEISYRLVLLGMLLILASVLANYFLISDSRVFDLRQTGNFWLNLTFTFGFLCYLIGVIILSITFMRQKPVRGWMEYALLTLLTLFLPVVLMMPLMRMFNINFDALAAFGLIYSLPLIFIAILGFAWLLLAGWLITHHNPRDGSPGEPLLM